ncbi:uncharacterized protein LAESUDRAFT_681066 [Laetiporus sulphureus 93-53]|uniref:Uncharacterized protein n=1 Tax=Laetiporus sulphureus 93-53 TaxID=1314785 RepID=A0A165DT78_9APHY|nr:uncharacterized protein LAESUDRAFT_681066 [Laetiporus sulphureus 93-53]KZT05579.1 hypothetical protein LAESUDRAFT_681066 [Laetiporus sulphureus 93-53]
MSPLLRPLVYKENHVTELQRHVQASHEPVYYRLPRGKLYVKSYYAVFAGTMAFTLYGAFSLIRGKPSTQ